MNITIRCVLPGFVFLVLCACTNSSEPLTFQVSGELKMPLDSVTSSLSKCIEYFNNKIYFLDPNSRDIHVFDPETNRNLTIPTHKEGPDNIGVVSGFKVFNDSLIAITANGYPGYALIDYQGTIAQKALMTMNPLLQTPLNTSLLGEDKMIFLSDGILMGQRIPGLWPTYSQEKINVTPIERWYSAKDSSVTDLNITYPNDYWKSGIRSFLHGRILVKNQLVYTFSFSDKISVFDFAPLAGTVSNRRDYEMAVENSKPLIPESTDGDISGYLETLCKNLMYASLYWDVKNRVYYRTGYFGETDAELARTPANKLMRNRTSPFVLIMDENFKKIGEVIFEKYKYNLDMSFVKDGAFYISRVADIEEAGAEDYIIFDKLILNGE